MSVTPRKTRSQGPAEDIDLDHPNGHDEKSGWLNLENELTFYGSYHSTWGNKLIHFICIPLIVWSTLVLLSAWSLPNSLTYVIARPLAYQPSLALVFVVTYQLYYIALDAFLGLTCLPWMSLVYLTATYTYHFPPSWAPFSTAAHPTAVPLAWIVFTSAWIGQFIGHGVFERRAPALKDNLVQAIVTAPFFVHLEFMFEVFGVRPDLAKRVKHRVGARVRAFQRSVKKE
ncbi:putative endoplasmic reticulum protein [Papiliotrema laurentii]|uniref:Endoplasmic reticulum protein n=1 Tax=Papiliotrema laurentii TaxID=5418 RepID=A0AAD9L7K0_PAPLA|nr:putative endoplasmic reticulum protein [Papiliotrema laurentii]